MGVFQYCAGDYEPATETLRSVIPLHPGHPNRWLTAALGQLGRKVEAENELSRAVGASPALFHLITAQRPPWYRLQDYDHMLDGLRKAGWQG